MKRKIVAGLTSVIIGLSSLLNPTPVMASERASINLARHTSDVEERVRRLHPVLQREYDVGKFAVDFEPTENEDLNAGYDQDSKRIVIECTPDYKRCNTDAFEHELIHYIDQHLDSQERSKIYGAIQRMISQPEMSRFRKEMAEFQKIHDFGDKVHEQYLLPMDYCKHLITTEEDARKVLKRAQILAKISKKKGINTSQLNNARNSLESRLENLHGVMSSCNLNNYQSAKAKKPEIMAEIRKSVQAEKAIYEKQKHSYNMPKFTIPLRSPSPMAYHNAWNQTMRSVVQTYKQAMNVASHIDSSGNLEKALTQSMRTYIHGQKSPPVKNVHKKFGLAHDNKPSEQFAAAGDSLLNGHKGKLTYLPLRFKLNKNVLNAMEGLTYRGAHIFKKPVDNY